MLRIIFRRCGVLTSRQFFLLLLVTSALILIYYQIHVYDDSININYPKKLAKLKIRHALSQKYILEKIYEYNSEQRIQNVDIYGNVNAKTVIFVVFVDKFSNDFHMFLTSLSEIQGIEEALIVFSHSYYEDIFNHVIEEIKFCRFMQIFYPYSVQTHSREFPGHHANDCPHDMNKKTAMAVNCTGASFPDIRGHYRNPVKAEKKHHWWWTANQIFETLNCTKKYPGAVMFVEDDFVFTKDFIYMTLFMKNVAGSLPQCQFYSMGTNLARNMNSDDIYAVELTTWDPKFHSRVLAFDLSTWNIIVSYYNLFCILDDTSWARSLDFISHNRKNGERFKVMSSVIPRAFKMNHCEFYGMFGCDVDRHIKDFRSFQKENEDNWFPPHVELYINLELDDDIDITFDYRESEGGWADPRDMGLCRNMTRNKMKKIIMEMHNEFYEYIPAG